MSEIQITTPPDLPEHIAAWENFQDRLTWERAVAKGANVDIARDAIAHLPEMSALEALAANRAAVELLVGRRWYVMKAARETGETWEAIGNALGISKQGAQDYYRRQIQRQEKYVSTLHEADRARAAISEGSA